MAESFKRKVVSSGTSDSLNSGTYTNPDGMCDYGAVVEVCSGGIFSTSGATYSKNSAILGGGAIWNAGTTVADNATFTQNSTTYSGGAIGNSEGGALTVSGGSFSGNTAGYSGGAIYNSGSTASVSEATFTGNTAVMDGGAIYNDKGVVTISGVTFSGNSADSGNAGIFDGGAIYNKEGTVNLLGAVTLKTATDTIFNASGATLNWDLSNAATGNDVVLNGYEYLVNEEDGALTITVSGEPTVGDYVIATGNLANLDESVTTFTVKTATDGTGVAVTVGEGSAVYNMRRYTLTNSGTELKLNVDYADPVVLVTVDTEEKWFKSGDTVTVTGTITDYSETALDGFTVSVGGAEAVSVTPVRRESSNVYDWSYTYDGKDTDGANLVFAATNKATPSPFTGTAEYTLMVDKVAPAITFAGTDPQYYATTEGVHWYKSSATDGSVTATATDATSGVKSIMLGGEETAGDTKTVTLDLSNELGEAKALTFKAVDNAGNVGEDRVFKYNVDGTGPEIGAASITGDNVYGNWIKSGTAFAVKTTIADAKSGLNKATLEGITYADGKFDLIAGADGEVADHTITATDNVGNEKTATVAYGFDGTGPSITVTHDPAEDVTASVVVTAVIADGEGSGVKSLQYTFNGTDWTDYTGAFTVTDNGTITFKGIDNVGNETIVTHTITNIGDIPPVVTIDADTATLQESVTFSVSAESVYSKVSKLEYSINGGTDWTPCTITPGKSVSAELTATVNNTTYSFRAYDEKQNVSEIETVTFSNIYKGTEEEDFSVVGTKVITPETPISTETLKMSGDAQLINDGGSVETGTLEAAGTGNVIAGDLISVDAIKLAEGAELGMNKNQYDSFMADTEFATDDGKLIVSEVDGNALRSGDIDTLMNKTNVTDVEFEQNLIDVNRLNVKSTKATTIGFLNAYGTDKGDTIRFYKDTNLTFGSKDGEINLEEGVNTIQIDNNATVAIKSKLTNASMVKSAKGSTVSIGDITFQQGRNASLKADGTSFTAGNVNGADKSTAITTGIGTVFTAAVIDLGDKNDKLSVGRDGTFAATSLDFGEGTDTFTVGSRAEAKIDGGVSGMNRLTLASGTYDKKTAATSRTKLTAKAVTGTEKADTYSFGNYSAVDLDSVDLGADNDTLKIGSSAVVEIDSLDFGEGTRDALTIGSGSKLTVKNLDVNSLDKLSMGKGATLYLGADSYSAAMNTAWGQKYSAQIAQLA